MNFVFLHPILILNILVMFVNKRRIVEPPNCVLLYLTYIKPIYTPNINHQKFDFCFLNVNNLI